MEVPDRHLPVELLSWWSGTEQFAPLPLWTRAFQAKYGNETLLTPTATLSGNVRAILRVRMSTREPPDIFQANAGQDLMQWVLINGVDDRESVVRALSDDAMWVQEMRRLLPRQVLESVSKGATIYGAVGNIRRINSVFYNMRIFRKFGLSLPKSPDDMLKIAKTLQANGVALMAVGSRDPWTLVLLVFESLLVAREGATCYREYFEGRLQFDDPRVVRVLRETLELARYFNTNHPHLTWNQALERVSADQAAMASMGDWAQEFFLNRGMRPGVDYVEAAFPGAYNDFVFTADAFAIPARARNPEGAQRALATLVSPEAQRIIHIGKGSMTARTDVALEEQDPVLREKYRILAEGNTALAMSGLVPPSFADELGVALADMLRERDVEPVLQTMKSRHALLRR